MNPHHRIPFTPIAFPPTKPGSTVLSEENLHQTRDRHSLHSSSQPVQHSHIMSQVLDLRTFRSHSVDTLQSPPVFDMNLRDNTCPHCDYKTNRRSNLIRHLFTMHQTQVDVPQSLECCDLKFASKSDLKDHKKEFHRDGYQCSHCARKFARRALLKRHMNVHSGFKEFKCIHCTYATSHKSNLDRHFTRLHGEQQVPRNFSKRQKISQEGYLSESMNLDSGSEDSISCRPRLCLQPYRCISCDSGFYSQKDHFEHSERCRSHTNMSDHNEVQMAALALIELKHSYTRTPSPESCECPDVEKVKEEDHPFLQTI